MATSEIKLNVAVQSMDKFQTLIALLNRYQEELPIAVLGGIRDLADCEDCEINRESIERMGLSGVELIGSHVGDFEIESVNPVLKRLTVIPSPARLTDDGMHVFKKHVYLSSYSLRAGDVVIAEW